MEGYKRAFPFTVSDVSRTQVIESGMTLRDYFAAKAMHATLCDPEHQSIKEDDIAMVAYSMADAMMKAREL